MSARAGFTLVEILVSVALAMLLTGAAVSMFFQAQRLVRRTQARLQLHATAKTVFETLRRDATAWQQDCACWLISRPAVAPQPASVDLVFMTAVSDNDGFTLGEYNVGGGFTYVRDTSDLVWTCWRWTDGATDPATGRKATGTLQTARNRMSRTFARAFGDAAPVNPGNGKTYGILGWYKYGTQFNPQPRRMTPGDDIAGLDENGWSALPATAPAAALDVGDWTDLQQRLAPVSDRVAACAIELVAAGDGGGAPAIVRHADGTVAANWCARGVRLDGLTEKALGVSARDEIAERPAILRLAFTLRDPATGVAQDFSFSVALPGAARNP